jgi:hypothetical protein
VDVNDVSYALEKVIEQRRSEDTWQIDTFGSVSSAPIRPPDEVSINSCVGWFLVWDGFLCGMVSCVGWFLVWDGF